MMWRRSIEVVVGGVAALVSNAIVDPWGNAYRYRYDPDDASWENFNYPSMPVNAADGVDSKCRIRFA